MSRPTDVRTVSVAALLAASLATAPLEARALRPFDGTDATVTSAGDVEFELGPLQWVHADGTDAAVPSLTVNVGVARDWEVSVFAQAAAFFSGDVDRDFAWIDDGVVLKRILREGTQQGGRGPSVAVEVSSLLPATSPLDEFGARVTPVVSQTWKGVTAHLSANLLWTRDRDPAVGGDLILDGFEIAEGVRLAAEGTVGWERDQGRVWSALAAVFWDPTDHLQLDLGFRVGRTFGATTRELRAGLTWWFTAWHPRAE
jgi:hypothetical protein